MRVFGCARKIGSNGKLFLLIVKYALWSYKSISVFILPSNHFRNSQTRKERKRERKEDSQTQTQTQQQDRAPTPDAAARSSPNPKRRGEIAPSSLWRQVLSSHRSRSQPKAHRGCCCRSRSRSQPKARWCRRSHHLDLIAPMISSSHSRLDLIVAFLSLKFSITLSSSLSQFDQICMKFNELFWAYFCFFKVYLLKFL